LRRIDDQLVRCDNLTGAGASNRDIATALFISPKTVSVHVSALLRKFGVSGRGDLGAAVQSSEAGLPPYGSPR
jgi:DNA-binding CsgD family transcriptional regulator